MNYISYCYLHHSLQEAASALLTDRPENLKPVRHIEAGAWGLLLLLQTIIQIIRGVQKYCIKLNAM